MNTTSPQRRLVLTSILGGIGLLSACSSGVKLDDLSTMKTDEAKGSNIASQPWNDPKSPLFQRSIYFDFDEYTIKPQYQNMLLAGAAFLKQNPQQKQPSALKPTQPPPTPPSPPFPYTPKFRTTMIFLILACLVR